MELWKTRTDLDYLLFWAAFHFAQRARCAAAMRLRAAADMVRRFAGTLMRPRRPRVARMFADAG